MTFSFILIAPSAILAAFIGIDIKYHRTVLKDYFFHISVYVFALPFVLYVPLLVFIPHMLKAKTWGIGNYAT